MEKNLRDYLHLYLGCEAMHADKKIVLCGLNVNSAFIQNMLNEDTILVSEIKPILRPFSDMTEKEVDALWECLDLNPAFQYHQRKSYIDMWLNDEPFSDKDDQFTFTESLKGINWLRKNEFDCDGLIEAGLAIDKTQIHEQRNKV